ncbi:MAG: hypothetical protein ACE5NG_12410 [bacterium]
MPPKNTSKPSSEIKDYRHEKAKRKDKPPIGLVACEPLKEPRMKPYTYDPHLSPQLVWARKPRLKQIEVSSFPG